MGPNVKFVSAITDAFSNKKNGGQFFSAKKTKPGGGGPGGLVKAQYFCRIFFDPFPKVKYRVAMKSVSCIEIKSRLLFTGVRLFICK